MQNPLSDNILNAMWTQGAALTCATNGRSVGEKRQKHTNTLAARLNEIQSFMIIPSAFTLMEKQTIMFIVSGANAVRLLIMRSPGLRNMAVPPDGTTWRANRNERKLRTGYFHSGGAIT